MVIRKNAETLGTAERLVLVDAIRSLKADGTYDKYVLAHARAKVDHIHGCPAFLPWHRQFIFEFERDLQRAANDPDLGLPYWDWTQSGEDSSIWDAEFMGGSGIGPFNHGNWTIVDENRMPAGPLIREFGVRVATLPTANSLSSALRTKHYDQPPWDRTAGPSFRNRLEGWYGAHGPGLHNRGHAWVGGSMLPMTSPNDPVFFLHHSFVDKIWADWQALHPGETYQPSGSGPLNNRLGQRKEDLMERTVYAWPRVDDVLDIEKMGYAFDDALTTGQTIGLKSHHKRWLIANPEGTVNAAGPAMTSWARFFFVNPNNPRDRENPMELYFGSIVSLRGAHGLLLSADGDGNACADAEEVGLSARWTIVNPADERALGPVRLGDRIALRSMDNRYLVATKEGDAKADSEAVGPREEWRLLV